MASPKGLTKHETRHFGRKNRWRISGLVARLLVSEAISVWRVVMVLVVPDICSNRPARQVKAMAEFGIV